MVRAIAKWCGLILIGILLFVPATGALSPDIAIWSENDWVVAGDSGGSLILVNVTEGGIPLAGVDVVFSCDPKMGSIVPSAVRTGNDGKANALFSPGTTSGSATITATVVHDDVASSATCVQMIDHGIPCVVSPLEWPEAATIGTGAALSLVVSDRWGNPVDNMRETETVALAVGSPANGTHFASGGHEAVVPLGGDGRATTTLILDTMAGDSVVQVVPPSPASDLYLTIAGVANGTPTLLRSTYASPLCPADGQSTFLIAYTIEDEYGNPCYEAPIDVKTSLGESVRLFSNSYGSVFVRYGPKHEAVDVVVTATALENQSVMVSDALSFYGIEGRDMVLTASPQNMKSADVDSSLRSRVIAKVTGPGGEPVSGETVIFKLVHTDVGPFTVTASPSLFPTSAVTDEHGFAVVEFKPGALATSGQGGYDRMATGISTVTATWKKHGQEKEVSRSIDLYWRNYPALLVTTSAAPSRIRAGNMTDVTISLEGDGWALSPAPVDVMMCISRAPTMLGGYPDPMVIARNASKYFAGEMAEGTDRLGLVSYGYETGDGKVADLNAMHNSVCHRIGRDTGGNGRWCDDANYVSSHYKMNGLVCFSDNVTLDLSLDRSFNSFNAAVDRLLPYAPASESWGQTKKSGDEFGEALNMAITHLAEEGEPGHVKAVVAVLDDDWNRGYASEYWQSMVEYAVKNDVTIYVVLVDTPKGNGAGGINDHQGLEMALLGLAEETGGSYLKVTDEEFEDEIESFYHEIAGGLKAAAACETHMDTSYAQVTVDDFSIEGKEVLAYESVPGVSTLITNATGHRLWANDSVQWAQGQVLHYDIGTIEPGQTWSATLRFNVSQPGTIGLFTDGKSVINFNDREGRAYSQKIPPLYLNVSAAGMDNVFESSTLSIPALTAAGDDATGKIAIRWELDYAGSRPETVKQRVWYQYSSNNIVWDGLWTDASGTPAVREGVSGDYATVLDTRGKKGWYRVRVYAREDIEGGADAWRTTLEPCRVSEGARIKIRIV